jgi:hypothetical protein
MLKVSEDKNSRDAPQRIPTIFLCKYEFTYPKQGEWTVHSIGESCSSEYIVKSFSAQHGLALIVIYLDADFSL